METLISKSYGGAQTRLILPKLKDVAGVTGDNCSTRLAFKLPKPYASGWTKYIEFNCTVERDGQEIYPTYLLDENNSFLIPYEISSQGGEIEYNLKFVSNDGSIVEKSEIGTLYFRTTTFGTDTTPEPTIDILTYLVSNAYCSVSYEDGTSSGTGTPNRPVLTFTPMSESGNVDTVTLNVPYLDSNGHILKTFIDSEITVEVYHISSPSELTGLTQAQVPDMALIDDESAQGESHYMDLYMLVDNDPTDANSWYLVHTDNPTFSTIHATSGDFNTAITVGLTVTGDEVVSGDVAVTGQVTTAQINTPKITGTGSSPDAPLEITGNTTVKNGLTVEGSLASQSFTDNGSQVNFTNNITASNVNISAKNVTVSTKTTTGTLESGAAKFTGNIDASGKTVTASTFSGDLSGNATTATTAQDYDENTGTIKSALDSKLNRACDNATIDVTGGNSSRVGKALLVDAQGGITYGEAGKVDAVQINGTSIAGDGAQTKVANITVTNSNPTLNYNSGNTTKVGEVAGVDLTVVMPDYAPKSHASSNTTYGVGSDSNYGHVKFKDSITSQSTPGATISEQGIKDFVNSSIEAVAAYYITYTQAGDPYPTVADLKGATIANEHLWSAGSPRTPTKNDYAIVVADETKITYTEYDAYTQFTTTAQYVGHYVIQTNGGEHYELVTNANHNTLSNPAIDPSTTKAYEQIIPSTRYIYPQIVDEQNPYNGNLWQFQYSFNMQYTDAQMKALNSGITNVKVNRYDTHVDDSKIHVPSNNTAGQVLTSNANGQASWENVTANNPSLSWGAESTIGTIAGTTFKVTMPANPDTDAKVTQTLASGNANRPLLMSYGNTDNTTADVTNIAYRNNSIYANAYTGSIYASKVYSNASEVVNLADAQTITGDKTFSSVIYQNSSSEDHFMIVRNPNLTTGTIPSSDTVRDLLFRATSGTRNHAYLTHTTFATSGDGQLNIGVRDYTGENAKRCLFVMKATTNPYATISYKATPTDDDEILTMGNGVTLKTAQDISGVKTFTSTIKGKLNLTLLNSDLATNTTVPSSTSNVLSFFRALDDSQLGGMANFTQASGNRCTYIKTMGIDGTTERRLDLWQLANNTSYVTAPFRSYADAVTTAGASDVLTKAHLESAITIGGNKVFTGNIQTFGTIFIGSPSNNAGVEIYHSTPFIDFHHDKSSTDYTSRIINQANGELDFVVRYDDETSTKYLKLFADGYVTAPHRSYASASNDDVLVKAHVADMMSANVGNGQISLTSSRGTAIDNFTVNQSSGNNIVLPASSTQYTNQTLTFALQSTPDFSDYPYMASKSITGLTADMYASVTYDDAQVSSGQYAPFCQTLAGEVRLYAKSDVGEQTIPTISIGMDDSSAQQSMSNFVTLTGSQTVAGEKTFTAKPLKINVLGAGDINDVSLKISDNRTDSAHTIGSNTADFTLGKIGFFDGSGQWGGTILSECLSTKNGQISISAKAIDGSLPKIFRVIGGATSGTSYSTSYYRTYNASNTSDIVTIGSLQASTDVVHTSGNETISGAKSFLERLLVKRSGVVQTFVSINDQQKQSAPYENSDRITYLQFLGDSNKSIANIEIYVKSSGNRGIRLTLYDKNNNYHYKPLFEIDENGNTTI